MTEYHKLSGLNNGNLLSHGSGRQKSEIKVWAGLVPSEAVTEGLGFPAFPGAPGALLAVCGIPRLVGASP